MPSSGARKKAGRKAAAGYFIQQCDALTFLQGLEDASVDLIITDPPYESLEKHRAVGTTTRLAVSRGSSNAWFQVISNAIFPALFEQMYRVLRPDSHLYLFCDQETAFIAKPEGERAGFKFWKPLIWDKKSIGMGYHYRARYEFILFFEKGKRRLKSLSVADVIEVKRVRNGYPTEKPPGVAEVLIDQSAPADGLVLDPFMGSGSPGSAALSAGRRLVGCDVAPQSLQVASERLASFGASDDRILPRRRQQLLFG